MANVAYLLTPIVVLVSSFLTRKVVKHRRTLRDRASEATRSTPAEPQETPQALLFSFLVPHEIVEYLCIHHLSAEDVKNARLVCLEWARGIPAKLAVKFAAVTAGKTCSQGAPGHDQRCLVSQALGPRYTRAWDAESIQTRDALPALEALDIKLPLEPAASADDVEQLCSKIGGYDVASSSSFVSKMGPGVVRASVHLDCNGAFVNLQNHNTAQVQDELIKRSDQVWAVSNIIAQLPAQLQALSLTSDTCLPAAPLLTKALARFTALKELKLGAGYGVVSEVLSATSAASLEALHLSHLKWPDSKPATQAWEMLLSQLTNLRSLTIEELTARDDGGFLHRGQADVHLAGVRASSPLTLLQGLHLLNGVTAGRFPNLEALHLDADNAMRLSSSQAAYREAVQQLAGLSRLTSLRGLALVLRYDTSEAYELLTAVSQLRSLHLELFSASYYEHQAKEVDDLLAWLGRNTTDLRDLKVSCFKRRPIVLRQVASLASLPPGLTSLDLFVHHVVAPGPPEQLLGLRSRLAQLRNLSVTSYRAHEGLLLPASCLPARLTQLRCDGAVVVQLPAAAGPGTLAVVEAELVSEPIATATRGASAGAGVVKRSSRDAASSGRGKAAAADGGGPATSSSGTSRASRRGAEAGQEPAPRKPGKAAGQRSNLRRSDSRSRLAAPAVPAAASQAVAVAAPRPKLYSRLVQLCYSPLEAVQLAGLPLLRELTLCMDLHAQAQQQPLSYYRCLPSAQPPAAAAHHAPSRRQHDADSSHSDSSDDDTESPEQAPQRPAAVVDTSRRPVRIVSLPYGLQRLRVVSARPDTAVQQRVVATWALVPGSLARLEALEISCAGDYEALLAAASQVQELKVVLLGRGFSTRDALCLLRSVRTACLRSLKIALCRQQLAQRPKAGSRVEGALLELLRRCCCLRTLKLRGVTQQALQRLLEGLPSTDGGPVTGQGYSSEWSQQQQRQQHASSSVGGQDGSGCIGGSLAVTLRELWVGELLVVQRPGSGWLQAPLTWLRRQRPVVQDAAGAQQMLSLVRGLTRLQGLRVFRFKDYSYTVGQGVKEEMHDWLAALLPEGCMVRLQIG